MNFSPQPDPSRANQPLNTSFNGASIAERFFEGMVQHTFSEKLGVPDPALITYVSDFLVRSIRSEALTMRTLSGNLTDDYAQMANEANNRYGEARVSAFQRLGERILFWSGLYPEAVAADTNIPQVSNITPLQWWFCKGREAYATLAQMVPVTLESGLRLAHPVYSDVSKRFEMVAYGLREVRRVIETDALEGSQQPRIY